MNKKGLKTTVIAYISLALIVALFVALFIEKINATELKDGITGIVAAAVVVIGFLSKDYDKSHTNES